MMVPSTISLDQIDTVHGGVREVVHDGWTAGGGTVQGAATGVNPKLREAGLAALGGCAVGVAFGTSGGPEAAVAGCLANGAKARQGRPYDASHLERYARYPSASAAATELEPRLVSRVASASTAAARLEHPRPQRRSLGYRAGRLRPGSRAACRGLPRMAPQAPLTAGTSSRNLPPCQNPIVGWLLLP